MMKLTSSCTETSTRSVPAHVCTTDGFPMEKKSTNLAEPARSPTHRRPGSPINTVRHRSQHDVSIRKMNMFDDKTNDGHAGDNHRDLISSTSPFSLQLYINRLRLLVCIKKYYYVSTRTITVNPPPMIIANLKKII